MRKLHTSYNVENTIFLHILCHYIIIFKPFSQSERKSTSWPCLSSNIPQIYPALVKNIATQDWEKYAEISRCQFTSSKLTPCSKALASSTDMFWGRTRIMNQICLPPCCFFLLSLCQLWFWGKGVQIRIGLRRAVYVLLNLGPTGTPLFSLLLTTNERTKYPSGV